MNYYNEYTEEAYDYLLEILGRPPTQKEMDDYLEEQDALAQDNYYSLMEDEQQGN